jgi:hypothetical protein
LVVPARVGYVRRAEAAPGADLPTTEGRGRYSMRWAISRSETFRTLGDKEFASCDQDGLSHSRTMALSARTVAARGAALPLRRIVLEHLLHGFCDPPVASFQWVRSPDVAAGLARHTTAPLRASEISITSVPTNTGRTLADPHRSPPGPSGPHRCVDLTISIFSSRLAW